MAADPNQTEGILDFLKSLFFDKGARQDFQQHPQQALEQAGLGDISAADVRAAMPQLMQQLPPDMADRAGPVIQRIARAAGADDGPGDVQGAVRHITDMARGSGIMEDAADTAGAVGAAAGDAMGDAAGATAGDALGGAAADAVGAVAGDAL